MLRQKILVTGAAGFIGSQISKFLVDNGHFVVGIDNLKTGYRANVPEGITLIVGDCADPAALRNEAIASESFDIIIHFAGQSSGEISFEDPAQDLKDNCVSTLNLLQFARETSCKKFIFASSMSVYGEVEASYVSEETATKPLSMYAVGKLASEHYLRIFENYGISSVSLRLFNVYGPGQNMQNLKQGMVSIYLAQALKNSSIVVKGSSDRFRDFVYIDDVVSVVSHFAETDMTGAKIFNLCTGVKTTVSEVIEIIKSNINGAEIAVSYTESTPGDQFGIFGDNHKLRQQLGPIDFVDVRTGIKRFVNALKTQSHSL